MVRYPLKISEDIFQTFVLKLINGYYTERSRFIKSLGGVILNHYSVNRATIEEIVNYHDRGLLKLLYRNGLIDEFEKRRLLSYWTVLDDSEFIDSLNFDPDVVYMYKNPDDIDLLSRLSAEVLSTVSDDDYSVLIHKSYREDAILFYLAKLSNPKLTSKHIDKCLGHEGRVIHWRLFKKILEFAPNLFNSTISPRLILYRRDIELIKQLDELDLNWRREQIVLEFIWKRPDVSQIIGKTYRIDYESQWLYNFIIEKRIDNDGTDDDWILYAICVGDIDMVRNKVESLARWGYFNNYRFQVSVQVQLAYYLGHYGVIDVYNQFGWDIDMYWHDIRYLTQICV